VNGVIGGDGDQGALVDQELGKEHGALGFALVFGMGIDARSSQTKKYIKNIILIRSSEKKISKISTLTCECSPICRQSLVAFVQDRRQRMWASMESHGERSAIKKYNGLIKVPKKNHFLKTILTRLSQKS